jgi:hypothetical protein
VCTLISIAPSLSRNELEGAVSQADKLDLIDPEALRLELDGLSGHSGLPKLRTTLDRRTFTMTDSELERRFLPIARRAGLPLPLTHSLVRRSGISPSTCTTFWLLWWLVEVDEDGQLLRMPEANHALLAVLDLVRLRQARPRQQLPKRPRGCQMLTRREHAGSLARCALHVGHERDAFAKSW